jgi:four helix bundle protein
LLRHSVKENTQNPSYTFLYLSQVKASETPIWHEFAIRCNYISQKEYVDLNEKYDKILGMLVTMSKQAKDWTY